MIDRDTARSLVLRYLSTLPCEEKSGWAIVDNETEDHDIMWLFCWTLKSLVKRGDKRPGTVGCRPILVDKADGILYIWALHEPLDRVLEKFRHDRISLPRLYPQSD
jgi:hypothetical protein